MSAARVARVAGGLRTATRLAGYLRGLRRPVRRDTVLYEAFGGAGLLCNPEALFTGLRAAPDLQHLRHVWAVRDPVRHAAAVAALGPGPAVELVEHGSPRYWSELQSAGWLVNNATFGPSFVKRPGQTYLNTWHGTPLKAMGYHVPGGRTASDNIIRNLLSADYLLSTSEHMTERMYLDGYRLRNVFTGAVVAEGYPRTDRQWSTDVPALRARLEGAGLRLGSRRVVLYAPTWRGGSFERPDGDVARVRATVERLRTVAGEGSVVLLRAHQSVQDQLAADPALAGCLVPADVPSNAVLALTDVLVSDWSSLFFDYLPLHRPVLFHLPDLADYTDRRGAYLAPEELPGPVSRTLDQLAAQLDGLLRDGRTGHEQAVVDAARRFAPREDGGATERVVDVVFRGREEGRDVRRGFADGRESLLVHVGQLLPNGMTSSATNLLRALDHDRYDVTVTCPPPTDPVRRAGAERLPEQVRWLPRRQAMLRVVLRAVDVRANRTGRRWAADRRWWELEWRRLAGQARFDRVVDLSGYSAYWTSVLLGSGRPVVLWQHNDVAVDAEREVGGRHPLRHSLGGTFRLYPDLAALVSVSPALAEVNRAALGHLAGGTPFLSARNVIDAEQVRRGALAAPPREEGTTTFVCVGRLSPEKNHDRLLHAFALVHAERPDSRLVVVGDGPLRPALEATSARLRLTGAVTFTGQVQNPWALMAAADCLVLSSDYEGQPMVVLEARVLGLPVVSTRFGSAAAAVPPTAGLLVERTPGALAEGMLAVLRGGVRVVPLDPVGYDAEVLAEFDAAIHP